MPDSRRLGAAPSAVMDFHQPKAQAAPQPEVRQAAVPPPPAVDAKQLQQMITSLPQLQPDVLADKVFKALEQKIKFEQRRSGF